MTAENPAKHAQEKSWKAEAAGLMTDVKAYLSALPASSRYFHIFYLCGPLILLIERSPADLWLSLCGLVFFCTVYRFKGLGLGKIFLGARLPCFLAGVFIIFCDI